MTSTRCSRSDPVFANDLPSSTMPEGLRGEHLKITGSDPEAEGQVALILGSYLTNLDLGGATSGQFALKFGADTTGLLNFDVSAADMQSALEALPGIGAGNVTVTHDGTGYHIALRGTLYLTDGVHFTVTSSTLGGGGGTTIGIDGSSVKLASAWSVEPQPPAVFEVGLFSDVHVPDVKVKVYSKATPSVVVFESDGSTAVDQGVSSDAIQVRLSSQPGRRRDGHPRRQRRRADLLQPEPGRQGPVTTLAFNSGNWDSFQPVYVNGVDDGVIRSFHRADLFASATGPTRYNPYLATVTIGDDNYPGVTVNQSGGSTNVIEYSNSDFGVSQATADAAGFPSQDSYTLALTRSRQARPSR